MIDSIREQMDVGETAYEFENRTSVVFVIGVNGVGKTTTIGKLAGKLKSQGKKVVLAAADTFRAAAGEQLREWANRADADMIGGQEGADPAAVIYDAVAAKHVMQMCFSVIRQEDFTKKNLMEELKKINRVIDREYPEAFWETLVVLDATTGQNALAQAKSLMKWQTLQVLFLQRWTERQKVEKLRFRQNLEFPKIYRSRRDDRRSSEI